MAPEELVQELYASKREIKNLHDRVAELEEALTSGKYLPETAILSDRFVDRAFAVYGHYLFVSLLIGIPIALISLIIKYL